MGMMTARARFLVNEVGGEAVGQLTITVVEENARQSEALATSWPG